MMGIMKFGKKLRTPSTFQIKHQLMLLWLKDQVTEEAAEAKAKKLAMGITLHVHDASF